MIPAPLLSESGRTKKAKRYEKSRWRPGINVPVWHVHALTLSVTKGECKELHAEINYKFKAPCIFYRHSVSPCGLVVDF